MSNVDDIRSAMAALRKQLQEIRNAQALSQWNKDNSPAILDVSPSGEIQITGWITIRQLRSADNVLSGFGL